MFTLIDFTDHWFEAQNAERWKSSSVFLFYFSLNDCLIIETRANKFFGLRVPMVKANWRKFIGNRAQNYCLLSCIKAWRENQNRFQMLAFHHFQLSTNLILRFSLENDQICGSSNKRDGNESKPWNATRMEETRGKMCTRLKITLRPTCTNIFTVIHRFWGDE